MILENIPIIDYKKKISKRSNKDYIEIKILNKGKEEILYSFNDNHIQILNNFKNKLYNIEIENNNNYKSIVSINENLNDKTYLENKLINGIIDYYNPKNFNKFTEEELQLLEKIFSNLKKYFKNFNILENYLEHNFILDKNLVKTLKKENITLEEFKYYLKEFTNLLKQEQKLELIKKIQKDEELNLENEEDLTFDPNLFNVKNVLNRSQDYIYQYKGKNLLGCSWGVNILDEKMDGIFGLVALTGAPGFGKTTLATQATNYNLFNTDNQIIYISLEISEDMLIIKLAGQEIGIPFKKILKDYLTYEETNKLYDYIEKILDLPEDKFFIIDKKHKPTNNLIKKLINYLIKQQITKYGRQEKEILIILDYLNLWNEFSEIRDTNEKVAQQIRTFMDIKNTTKTNWLIIVAKNKQGYKSADLASIKGTNDLEYAFENIVSLEDPENIDKNIDTSKINVIGTIIKNRWGENKINIPMYFNGRQQFFKGVYEKDLEE